MELWLYRPNQRICAYAYHQDYADIVAIERPDGLLVHLFHHHYITPLIGFCLSIYDYEYILLYFIFKKTSCA